MNLVFVVRTPIIYLNEILINNFEQVASLAQLKPRKTAKNPRSLVQTNMFNQLQKRGCSLFGCVVLCSNMCLLSQYLTMFVDCSVINGLILKTLRSCKEKQFRNATNKKCFPEGFVFVPENVLYFLFYTLLYRQEYFFHLHNIA